MASVRTNPPVQFLEEESEVDGGYSAAPHDDNDDQHDDHQEEDGQVSPSRAKFLALDQELLRLSSSAKVSFMGFAAYQAGPDPTYRIFLLHSPVHARSSPSSLKTRGTRGAKKRRKISSYHPALSAPFKADQCTWVEAEQETYCHARPNDFGNLDPVANVALPAGVNKLDLQTDNVLQVVLRAYFGTGFVGVHHRGIGNICLLNCHRGGQVIPRGEAVAVVNKLVQALNPGGAFDIVNDERRKPMVFLSPDETPSRLIVPCLADDLPDILAVALVLEDGAGEPGISYLYSPHCVDNGGGSYTWAADADVPRTHSGRFKYYSLLDRPFVRVVPHTLCGISVFFIRHEMSDATRRSQYMRDLHQFGRQRGWPGFVDRCEFALDDAEDDSME